MLARACCASVVIGACYVACLFAVTRPTDDRNDSRVFKKRCVASAVSCRRWGRRARAREGWWWRARRREGRRRVGYARETRERRERDARER